MGGVCEAGWELGWAPGGGGRTTVRFGESAAPREERPA